MSAAAVRTTSLRTMATRGIAGFAVFVVIVGLVLGFAVVRLTEATDAQLNRWAPALLEANALITGLVDQETGVRGFAGTGDDSYLQPFDEGRAQADAATNTLRDYLGDDTSLRDQLDDLDTAAQTWRTEYAEPVVAAARIGQTAGLRALVQDPRGKQLFDDVRARYSTLQANVSAERAAAVERVRSAVTTIIVAAAIGVAIMLGAVLFGGWVLRRRVIRPVTALAAETRVVAGGEYDHQVHRFGPTELHQLGADVEEMRIRIVAELAEVQAARTVADRTSASLARSNADLEQFAYVASHDLQEPLRKVSNFCQLLERQYASQLDDRAVQYIGFAVDGAKRMQTLINDLLSFSRVGRNTELFEPVDTAAVALAAVENLSDSIADTGAEVVLDPALPTLLGDATLLTTLFQNLIGNAIKYHGDETPKIEVAASRRTRDDPGGGTHQEWAFAVQDNGIGIEAQYAQRIFVIFQRLHLRDSYGGTGIGLAMCKKIVEYHGGAIWLDPDSHTGSRFCFTIPDRSTA